MADPGKFDLKAEVKLTKCDSIPEIRDNVEIAGLDYSSSCTVRVEADQTVALSIQCQHETLKYLLIKPLKVVIKPKDETTPEEWTDVDKLPSRDELAKALFYKSGENLECGLGTAQAFYEGLVSLLLSGANGECSLSFQLKSSQYLRALIQVVTAGIVQVEPGTPPESDCQYEYEDKDQDPYQSVDTQTTFVTPNDNDNVYS